jgi:ferredoxin
VFCRKEKSGRETTLQKLLTVQSESAWPRLTPSCICQDIPANNCKMLQQGLSSKTTVGNPGLAYKEQAPAWSGFRIASGMAQVVHTPHPPQGPPGSGPSVSFPRSGITAAWDQKFGGLLELAEAYDVPVSWSCRTGVGHTCMTGLIGGSVVNNPEPLERPAPGNVLVCCCQPIAGVTLDL